MKQLKVPADRVKLMLNKVEPDVGMDVAQVTRYFPQGFEIVMPYGRDVNRSLNMGMPVLAFAPHCEVSKALGAGLATVLPAGGDGGRRRPGRRAGACSAASAGARRRTTAWCSPWSPSWRVSALMVAFLVGSPPGRARRHRRAPRPAPPTPCWPTEEAAGDGPDGAGPQASATGEPVLEGLAGRAADLAGQRRRAGRPAPLARRRRWSGPASRCGPASSSSSPPPPGLGVAALLLAVTGSVLVALVGPVVAVAGQQPAGPPPHRQAAQGVRGPAARRPQPGGVVAVGRPHLPAGHPDDVRGGGTADVGGVRPASWPRPAWATPWSTPSNAWPSGCRCGTWTWWCRPSASSRRSAGGWPTLLHTLSDFIRLRAELRREVLILTAEGRMSAYVLAGLVPFLFVMMKRPQPHLRQPALQRDGAWSSWSAAALSVLAGLFVILRMVKIDV